jgi:hypothetical protein
MAIIDFVIPDTILNRLFLMALRFWMPGQARHDGGKTIGEIIFLSGTIKRDRGVFPWLRFLMNS